MSGGNGITLEGESAAQSGGIFLAEGGRAALLQSRVFERNVTQRGWFGGSARVFLHAGLRTRRPHRSPAIRGNGKAIQAVQEQPAKSQAQRLHTALTSRARAHREGCLI